ncbi:sensor histidine kinase [Ruminiclostridium cellobioparum]|uniref:sensor histidine kinase n=1 Tax=Ruminiclostridium cellobioparum TaxID=29355 RepID=UPI000558E20F|nr:histidine kinase [Ruminiclostridium cellobioparum]
MKNIVYIVLNKIKCLFFKKLANKLVLLFSAIIILTIISLTFVSYKIIEKESVKNIIDGNRDNLTLINKNIESYFNDINQVSLPNIKYDNIMNALLGVTDELSAEVYLEDYIRSMFYSRNDFEGICLYIVEQNCYYYITRGDGMVLKVRKAYNTDVPNEDWYIRTIKSKNNVYIESLFLAKKRTYSINQEKCFFAYHRAIKNIVDKKPYAVLSFFCNYSTWNEIIRNTSLTDGEQLIFMGEDGSTFYSNNKDNYKYFNRPDFKARLQKQGTNMFDWKSEDKSYLTIYNASDSMKFRLVKLIPYKKIYSAAQTNRSLGTFVGCIILVISVILVVLSANAITKPVKKLTKKMHSFSEGRFDLEAKVEGNDEIAELTIQFNLMVAKINDLINEEYKTKLEEKNAILKALEAELNPHFLYNALQAISTTALKIEAFHISDMVDALASTFRYTINGKNLVRLENEIKYIDDYLIIQKARFGNRLTVTYEMDDNVLDVLIPKISIQILVENSIKHVLEKSFTSVAIIIKAYLEGNDILISVSDNGPGISPERFKQIRFYMDSENGQNENKAIGLKNLDTRLHLLYKGKSSLYIESDGTGTTISFIIPDGGNKVEKYN